MSKYRAFYDSIAAPWRRPPSGARVLAALDRALAVVVALAYVVVCAFLLASGDGRLARAIAVPAATFLVVSGLRAWINAPRPYEVEGIDPLIAKDTHGKSLPSRHVASVTIIVCTFAWLDPWAGAASVPAMALISYVRIVGGVHYPRDVVAALVLSLSCALIGFFVI